MRQRLVTITAFDHSSILESTAKQERNQVPAQFGTRARQRRTAPVATARARSSCGGGCQDLSRFLDDIEADRSFDLRTHRIGGSTAEIVERFARVYGLNQGKV